MSEMINTTEATSAIGAGQELTASQRRKQALPDLVVDGLDGEPFSLASHGVQPTERAVFEPWDEQVDGAFREDAFRDVLGTYRLDRRVRTVLGNFRRVPDSSVRNTEWSFYKRQAKSYPELNLSDTEVLTGAMERGLSTYARLWGDQDKGEMNFVQMLYDADEIPPTDNLDLAHLTIAHDMLAFSSLGLAGYLAYVYGEVSEVDRKDLYQTGIVGSLHAIKHGDSIYWGVAVKP